MKDSLSKLRTLCFLIASLAFLQPLGAQTWEQTKAYADSLMACGQAEKAELCYERVLFFCPLAQKAQLCFSLGESCLAQNRWMDAKQHFSQAMAMPSADSLKMESYLQRALCSIMAKDFFAAFIELGKTSFAPGSILEKKRILYQATCQYGMGQYEMAQRLYASLLADRPEALQALQQIFRERKFEDPSPELALLFSLLLPGLGQVYAGDWKQAGNSFAINAVLWSGFVAVIIHVSVLDAFVAVFPWAWRYFHGGCLNAKRIAEDRMLKDKDIEFQKILGLLEH